VTQEKSRIEILALAELAENRLLNRLKGKSVHSQNKITFGWHPIIENYFLLFDLSC
jgi:hypothetical protein